MSGLVTLLSERLETIARLWDAGLPTWAYVTVTVRRSGLTADQFMGIRAFFRLARQEKKKRTESLLFLSFAPICTFLDTYVLLSLISSLPHLLTNHRPSPSLPRISSVTIVLAEALPMLIIVGGAVGGGCVLLICVITLVSLCCRHTGKGELNG